LGLAKATAPEGPYEKIGDGPIAGVQVEGWRELLQPAEIPAAAKVLLAGALNFQPPPQ